MGALAVSSLKGVSTEKHKFLLMLAKPSAEEHDRKTDGFNERFHHQIRGRGQSHLLNKKWAY